MKKISKVFYAFGSDGSLLPEDWVSFGGKWYYVAAEGKLQINPITINGVTYKFSVKYGYCPNYNG